MSPLARGFSRQHRITAFAATATHRISGCMGHGFACTPPYILTPVLPLTGAATFLRHPIAWLLPAQVPRSTPSPPTTPKGDGQYQALRMVSIHGPHHGRDNTGTGISTRCPSTTPVGLALGPDSPWADEPGPGTLGHSAAEILTLLSLLMPAFSLAWPPPLDHSGASPATRRSPTHPHRCTHPHKGRRTSNPHRGPARVPRLRRCA